MCGIVGYIGPKNATPIIMNGLKKLEYRGYDSAGIAVLENGGIEVRRDAGKLESLTQLVQESPLKGILASAILAGQLTVCLIPAMLILIWA